MGKGGDFEREIAKTLTVWLTGKEKPYMYWRMPEAVVWQPFIVNVVSYQVILDHYIKMQIF